MAKNHRNQTTRVNRKLVNVEAGIRTTNFDLRERREKLDAMFPGKYTVHVLAGRLKVRQSTFTRWENGHITPSPANLKRWERTIRMTEVRRKLTSAA